jgi:hypothetical protein
MRGKEIEKHNPKINFRTPMFSIGKDVESAKVPAKET